MNYQENGVISPNAISDLRQAVGWNRMESCYQDPGMTSFYHIAVWHDGILIGFVDCVSNGVTDAYIQDLMVHPDYQQQGIGTELMRRMIAYLKSRNIYMISVVYEESLRPFYGRFGFTCMLSGQLETYECP